MKHVDGGVRCLVIHSDNMGQCILCDECREWLRPDAFYDTECPGKKTVDDDAIVKITLMTPPNKKRIEPCQTNT